MYCKKCNAEISEGAKFCPECGQPTVGEIATPKDRKSKKKIILSVVLILVIIVGSVGGFIFKKEKDKQKQKNNYALTFTETTIEILSETVISEQFCNLISKTWRNAIDDREDFNTAISDVLKKQSSTVSDLKKNKDKIEEKMKGLQNPPADYKDAYSLLVELYSTYGQIYSQAVSPTGSLTSYNGDVNGKASDFNKIYDKLAVLRPEIKKKK